MTVRVETEVTPSPALVNVVGKTSDAIEAGEPVTMTAAEHLQEETKPRQGLFDPPTLGRLSLRVDFRVPGDEKIGRFPGEGRLSTPFAAAPLVGTGARRQPSLPSSAVPFDDDTEIGGFLLQRVKARERAAADNQK